jgi:hypothetical protein
MKFKELALALSLAVCGVNLQEVKAHCNFSTTASHCASHLDPTRLIPGSARVAEEAWGEAGRAGYVSAARWMERDNIAPRAILSNRRKQLLRPEFGSLVDAVRIIYNADMMDEWSAAGYTISQPSAGQTFCNVIYLDEPNNENDDSLLMLLAHELEHSRQCERLGGMSNFGYHYFKEYKKAGQSYNNNLLEKQAEEVKSRFRRYLASQGSSTSSHSHKEVFISLIDLQLSSLKMGAGTALSRHLGNI